jgi:retron-type reverse transcriptase
MIKRLFLRIPSGEASSEALDVIHQNLLQGFTAVYDADLKAYFDST